MLCVLLTMSFFFAQFCCCCLFVCFGTNSNGNHDLYFICEFMVSCALHFMSSSFNVHSVHVAHLFQYYANCECRSARKRELLVGESCIVRVLCVYNDKNRWRQWKRRWARIYMSVEFMLNWLWAVSGLAVATKHACRATLRTSKWPFSALLWK